MHKKKEEGEREIVLDMQMIKQYGYVKCCFNFRCNLKWPERCYKIEGKTQAQKIIN